MGEAAAELVSEASMSSLDESERSSESLAQEMVKAIQTLAIEKASASHSRSYSRARRNKRKQRRRLERVVWRHVGVALARQAHCCHRRNGSGVVAGAAREGAAQALVEWQRRLCVGVG